MTKRKGELFAELKTQLKSRIESGDNANAKCCNQIVKFADPENIIKISGDPKMLSLPTLAERGQSEECNKLSQAFAKPRLDCFVDITSGGDDERKNNSDTQFNASSGKKTIQIEGGDKSEWTKKTEEFLMKLQNMECYSRHDEKTTSSGIDSVINKSKRKGDLHSRQPDKSVSPPYKKTSDRNLRESSSNHDDNMSSSHKMSDLKLKPRVNSGVSRDDIWETLQALRKEVAKLEKKRFEMASKSSKQNEKSMATAKQLEQEMKCQMKQLWRAIDDLSGDKKEIGSHDGDRSVSEMQSSRNKISFSLKSDKQRNPDKGLAHNSGKDHKDVEVDSHHAVLPTEARIANNVVPSGKPSNSKGELREKSNSMAHAMSERIKFATSLYLKAENFYDGGNLWCQLCNTLHKNVHEFSQHLHSQDHIKNSNCEDQRTSDDSERLEINPKSAPARGDEFFRPLKAYHCSLCNTFLSDITTLRKHFVSKDHNIKFKEFLANNDNYEVPYLTQKMAVILRKELSKDVRASVSWSLREERGH